MIDIDILGKLENEEVFIETDISELFVMKGEKGRFLFLCVDIDPLVYIVAPIDTVSLLEMLYDKVDMHDTFASRDTFYKAVAIERNEWSVDWKVKPLDKVSEDMLPYGGEFLDKRGYPRIDRYILKLEKELQDGQGC